jgi:hypothetical protein
MRRPEQEMHKAIVAHLRLRGVPGLVWWHTPNGGRRRPKEAAIMKGLGVLPGVSDLILIHRGHVYALELKAGDQSRPTIAQMEFISNLNEAGGHGVICHDLDRAIRCLECWGLLRGTAAVAA